MQRDTGCKVLEDQGLEDVRVGLSELSDMLRGKDQGTTTQHHWAHTLFIQSTKLYCTPNICQAPTQEEGAPAFPELRECRGNAKSQTLKDV